MNQYIGEKCRCTALFIVQVVVSIALLILLAFAVEGLPLRGGVEASSRSSYVMDVENRVQVSDADSWSELGDRERPLVIEQVEKEVGSAVGLIYISLGPADAPYRSTKNETHLFDTYGLMIPGSHLPVVLICPATSNDPDGIPPPFQTPPLSRIGIFPRKPVEVFPDIEELKAIPREYPKQRIPSFAYFNGVPVIIPKALGKIRLDMSAVDKIIAAREYENIE